MREGKWLKKESLAFEKLRSPVILLLVHVLILLDTVDGKRTGRRNSSNKSDTIEMPAIFNVRSAVLLIWT